MSTPPKPPPRRGAASSALRAPSSTQCRAAPAPSFAFQQPSNSSIVSRASNPLYAPSSRPVHKPSTCRCSSSCLIPSSILALLVLFFAAIIYTISTSLIHIDNNELIRMPSGHDRGSVSAAHASASSSLRHLNQSLTLSSHRYHALRHRPFATSTTSSATLRSLLHQSQQPSASHPYYRHRQLQSQQLQHHQQPDLIIEEVDAVVTAVNHSDPVWRTQLDSFNIPYEQEQFFNRWRSWDELRYCLRSISAYAPWIRRIHIVLAGPSQVPPWLNTSDPRLHIVFHEQLFTDDPLNELPTFNSLAIESVLHRIPGLSNHFLYFNNDVFLGRPTELSHFLRSNEYYRYVDWKIFAKSNSHPLCFVALKESIPFGLKPQPSSTASSAASSSSSSSSASSTQPFDADGLPSRWLREQCLTEDFFWDRVLARRHWGVRVSHWFAHAPHLWEVRVLKQIEAALRPQLAECRRNRWRDKTSDVSMHIQYESWLQRASDRHQPGERRVVARDSHGGTAASTAASASSYSSSFFHQRRPIFSKGGTPQSIRELNHMLTTASSPISTASALHPISAFNIFMSNDNATMYAKLDCLMRGNYRPQFFCLDDDLKHPSEQQLAFHRQHLTAFYRRHWHQVAPWEIAQQTPDHSQHQPRQHESHRLRRFVSAAHRSNSNVMRTQASDSTIVNDAREFMCPLIRVMIEPNPEYRQPPTRSSDDDRDAAASNPHADSESERS